MSITYSVAVPAGKWPSFAQMNALISARGYALEVLPQGQQSLDDPMQEFEGFLSFHAIFRGELQEMDCYHRVLDGFYVDDTNEMLADIGSDTRLVSGMHVWDFGFGSRTPPVYLAPYMIIAGILVLDCDGFGYEGQGPSFGHADWGYEVLAEADQMIATLAKPAPRSNKPPPASKPKRRIPINFWTICAAIIILLLIAEFIDQNIWNFTGT